MKPAIRILFTAACLLWAACTARDEQMPLPGELTLVPHISTRGVDVTSSLDGDLRVFLADNASARSAEALRFVREGGSWRGEPRRLLGEEESAEVYALYPCCGEADDLRAVPVEVASQTDWLRSARSVTVDRSRSRAEVTLEHALCVVAFDVRSSGGYEGEGLLEEICLGGDFPLTGTLDLTKRSIEVVSTGSFTLPCVRGITEEGWRDDHPALFSLPFRTTDGDVVLTFRIDGRDYSCSLPTLLLSAGKRYLFHLVLTPGRLTLLADRTETASLDAAPADPGELRYGVLRVAHTLRSFYVPRIDGSTGTVAWGDGDEERYTLYAVHQYDTTDPHTVEVECWNADEASFYDLLGVTAIDFSRF